MEISKDYRTETAEGISQVAGVWFNEPVVEMCIRSERYDQEMTLIHLPRKEPTFHEDEGEEDVVDYFSSILRS